MENSPILRSLVAGGRSSGTGRPTSSPSSARASRETDRPRAESFERHVERARSDKPAREDAAEASDENEKRAARQAEELAQTHTAGDDAPLQSNTAPTLDFEVAELDAPSEPQAFAEPHAASASPSDSAAGAPADSPAAPNANTNLVEVLDQAVLQLDAPGLTADGGDTAAPTAGAPQPVATGAGKSLTASTLEGGATSLAGEADLALPTELALQEVVEPLAPASSVEVEAGLPAASNPTTKEAPALSALSIGAPAPESSARVADPSPTARAEPPAPPAPSTLDAERSAQILRQVRMRFSPELRQAVIQLEPRELGRIAIRISVTRGIVRAELRAEHQTTLDALERHAPELKAALERAGLSAEAFDLHLGFDGASDGSGHSSTPSHTTASGARASEVGEAPLSPAQLRSVGGRLAAAGGVDTYA